MRLLVSNPDTLGDLVLRQPMFRALFEAGHELTLIVRPIVKPLAEYVAPGARTLELPHEVYAQDLAQHWDRFAQLFKAARSWEPDALIVAPYRWTAFDEQLADELPASVQRFGMNGHLYGGDPHNGAAPLSRLRFDAVADVCEDAAEVDKNAALASVVLGKSIELAHPEIECPEAGRANAAKILSQLGLDPNDYWIACVTGTANVSLKAWHRERWGETLSRWAESRGRKFLFVGLASEESDVRAVQNALSENTRAQSRVWMPPGGTIDELIGLTALSAGYVGHDTGPMHLAAALGKPVLAVFGGGHKLRFQPAAEPSVTVTVGVSCRGCEWICPFAESHCVKAVPVDEVLQAADDLENGLVKGREAHVLEPSPELQEEMIRESARLAEARLRESVETSRKLNETNANWNRDVAQLRSDADELRANVAQLRENEQRVRDDAEKRVAQVVREAHAELGDSLRDKELMIRQQDEQLRGKEAALQEQHSLLQAQQKSLQRTSEEAERLRTHAAQAAEQHAQLDAALQARARELASLQQDFEAKSREALQLASVTAEQREELDRLGTTIRELQRVTVDASRKQSDELGKLREQLQKLEERVRRVEPMIPKPRRPLKQVVVDFIIGSQHYYPPPPKALPGITIVTVAHNDESRIRDTIESVLRQTHAHVQYVVVDRGSTDGTLAILDAYRERITKITSDTPAGELGLIEALFKGYAAANYDVLGRLDPGEVYEPGALTHVAEHFRDHPKHKATAFSEVMARDGWRFPAATALTPDVYTMLGENTVPGGVFVTTNAYKSLGGLNRERGDAAEWDFLIRLARRYGIHRGEGHVRTTAGANPEPVSRESLKNARDLFESSFGTSGRIRCTLIHLANGIRDAIRPRSRHDFAMDPPRESLPAGVAPMDVPADQPVCPLSGRMPDRLLFSTRDTFGGDDAISYIYLDERANAAMMYPPIDLEKLQTIYRRTLKESGPVQKPDTSRVSPYVGYRGRNPLARVFARVRSPYWWFNKPDFGDTTVSEVLATLDGSVPRRGGAIRFLNVSCFEGGVLDALKNETDWKLFGTETNPDAARIARDKGHTIWELAAEDAALAIPDVERFEVIYLGRMLEHLADPLLVIRRLRQMLTPGGRIVIDTPNLDSKMLDVFGPTWSLWQAPYHRLLVGRRGLKTLAKLAAFKIERLRTRTHPLNVVKSVQLNDLGLGAVVPDTAEFPAHVASRGVLLTGWARLLWDWRGRGDYLYAVLKAE